MGRPKAWLPWFGRTLVEHVVGRLRPAVDEIVVVTSVDLDLPPLDVRVVRDTASGLGPLAGIRDGLAAVSAERAFVTSVDAPHVEPGHVEAMFAIGGAAAPVAEGRVQVLSAVYPGDAWSRADALLAEGERRPLRLLEAVGYKPVESLASDGTAPWHGFNTPEAYLAAVRAVDPLARARIELLGRVAAKAGLDRLDVPVGTVGALLDRLPRRLGVVRSGRVAKSYLACLGGRDLVRDLAPPVGPDETLSVLDALAGG
jgi:molybdopterin-guanine dinucleotide biosynthesis protein A